jgi:dihydrodipicolinate synthase/N-acetylneuraminate lyase
MNKRKRFEGVVIPVVTPVTAEHKLDQVAVEKIFAHLRKHGALPFILGTTGEAPSVPLAMKQEYIQVAGKLKQSGETLYAGISSTCMEESISLARFAFENGTDAVVATLPSYYSLTESEMERYFEQLADGVKGPLILYNIPATTHMSIPLSLIDRLSHHPNVVGIKDSERNEERLKQSLALWAKREYFSHFLGWAAKSADAVLEGSDGLVPSTGNFLPGIYTDLFEAGRAGDREKAFHRQSLSDLFGDLYQKGKTLGESLWALKVVMQEEGLCAPYVLPPLQEGDSAEAVALKKRWKELAAEKLHSGVASQTL